MARSLIYPMELFDETLDINATDNYDLTLEISEEGISLAVLDLLRGKYVMLRHYPLLNTEDNTKRSLEEIISGDDFMQRHYRKVIVITPSPDSTLVPSPLYEPVLKDDFYRFNLPAGENINVFANNLTFPGAVVLFTPMTGVAELLASHWSGMTPWHHTRPLLQHAFISSRSSDDRYLHLHIEKNFATVIIIEKRKLSFCNSFRCSAPGDVTYYLFSIFDKAGVKNDETLHLSGIVEPYGELHLSLLNFTESIKFASPSIRYSYSYVMNEVPMHRWLNLFTASSCE
ncbi:MAG: DUF3822 family protein [Bacteroidales bacterium]|nr:DUF3822 family protein [Bacteroidales bacterium]